jgi:putative membrane-bound dehydrogenase-like protein
MFTITRAFGWLLLLFLLVFCTRKQVSQSSPASEPTQGRRLEILFLGDNGHHRPIERIPSLMAALGPKGINLTYTDQLKDVTPDNLAKYDGLLIYANWDSIPAPQEKALLDYVSSGKGLIAVHCASYCFRNSADYVSLVGGQFWKHGWDTIRSVTVAPTHPIMAGVGPIKTLDETYQHTKVNPDKTVLMERIEGDKREPYTWIRNHGKGRMFYTAYGHDQNTWDDAGFQKLMENGIRWAVGEKAENELKALNPKPFAYAEANLPNYEKRPGPQLLQEALSPEESMKHIQVPVDFTLELFAHEPDVMHPIAMTWDERGRLFVLITKDYPNERKETGGSDYILLCEDTNKDGKADKFTRYADGLSIPTGLLAYNGGLIVSQAPHMLYLKDTNGDDKADEKKILFTGFGTFDTHAGPSNLHYGFDNWIWGSVGYSGFKGKFGEDSLKFGQGFFRFKPDGSKMEYMTSTSNNTWGLAFNETGDVFGSTANNSHGWYMPIPNQYFHSAAGTDNGSRSTDTHKNMTPITPRVRQVDVFGGFTAAAGHNFYTARAFPKSYWNKVAFVAEPTGHVLHQNIMEKKGTDYEDKEGFNLMAGADEWFSPVFAEVGPDGAVWVADWYSFIIQHNPTPKGFNNGSGNAYETDLRNFTHGRIYRVAYKQAPAYTPLSLSKDRPQELVGALKNTNLFWRLTAQRLLIERGNRDVVPQLLALVNDPSMDEIGINPGAIHALWTLDGLGMINRPEVLSVVYTALKHPCAGVRKTAVQLLPATEASVTRLLEVNALQDKEPLVVLNTILALSRMPSTPAADQALLTCLQTATEVTDRWLADAFACALTSHQNKLLKAVLAEESKKAAGRPKTPAPSQASSDAHAMHAGMNHNAQATVEATPKQADLIITGIRSVPAVPSLREPVRLFVDVKNQGGAAVPAGPVIPMSIRIEGAGKQVNMVYESYTEGATPGQTFVIDKVTNGPWTGPLSFTTDKVGEYTVTATVDPAGVVAENNERNNTFSRKLVYAAPKNMTAYALERAVRSYASVTPADSLVALLQASQSMEEASSAAVLKGIADGWPSRRKETLSRTNQALVTRYASTVTEENKDKFGRLMEAWGMRQSSEAADKDAQIVEIKAVREALQFSKKEFTVAAGKPVIIVFENPDAMQHNFVVGKPKSLEIIGTAADKLITAKDGAERNYVPSVPQVLFSSPLVNPDQTYRLKFTAPSTPGDYPFVCTFPGHWRIMNGVMKVR